MFTKEEFEALLTSIKGRLDETTGALVSEDMLGVLAQYNMALEKIAEMTTEIEKLTKDKEDLLMVNGRLYQKIGFEEVKSEEEIKEEKVEEMVIEDLIDGKGDFINE